MIHFQTAGKKKSISPTQEGLMWEKVFGRNSIGQDTALSVSAFYRAIDLRSDTLGKLPISVKNLNTRLDVDAHPLGRLLWERPNEAMTPFVYKKLLEQQRLVLGNSYVWIYRNGYGKPTELIPLPPNSCTPYREPVSGKLWYLTADPKTGQPYKLRPLDVLHYKLFSDGYVGVGVLTYAARTLTMATMRDEYEQSVYQNGGHPAGILTTETDLSNRADITLPDGTKLGTKDIIRREWERIHAGPSNAFRVAVLDNGLKYQPLSMSNSDAQFVENKAVTVEDIARFTGVPMHKLFAGDQSYNSNEANSLDYVKDSIQPAVTQYEEEDSFKLLTLSERKAGLWLPRNMMAELRGDTATRKEWYRAMRQVGVFSPNDICKLEDFPDVAGGDVRSASLNDVPLELFEKLSIARNMPQKREEKPIE